MSTQDEELVALACLAISLTPNQAAEVAEVNKVENPYPYLNEIFL